MRSFQRSILPVFNRSYCSGIIFEYSAEDGENWTSIGESYAAYNGSTKEYYTDITWNTKGLSGNYLVRVIARDKGGNESEPLTRRIIVDNTAPDAPTNVSAVVNAGKISVKWSPVQAEDVSSYSVYRKISGTSDNYSLMTTVKASILEYIDYNVDPGKTYIYCVTATDDLKNESSRSEEVQITAGDFAPELSIIPEVVKPADEIKITGQGFKPSETVEIFIDDSTILFNTKADSTGNILASWKYLKNVSPGSHSIKLKGQQSLTEVTASFTAEFSLLNPPAGIEAKAGECEVVLSWKTVDNASFYRLYRKTGDDELIRISDNIKGTSIRDIPVKSGVTYHYQLSSVDIYGNEGSLSDSVEAIPLVDSTKPVISQFTASRNGEILKLTTVSSDNMGVSSMKFYYRLGSGVWKEIIALTTKPEMNKSVALGYDWNTAALKEDGKYEVKAVAYDEAGNFSDDKIVSITIRNTKPLPPQEIKAVSGQLRIDVNWTQVDDSDFLKYRLYRRVNGGEYILIRETTLRSYQDNSVTSGKSYEYKVTVVDTYGHESDGAVTGVVSALADTTAPEIKNLMPVSGSRIKGIVNISAIASDNVALSKVEFLYSAKINGVDTWLTLGSSVSGTVSWDTAGTVQDGLCEIKVVAKDTSGNTSELKASYIVDNTAPEAPVIAAQPQELKVSLTWKPVGAADDLDHYNVYRASGIDSEYTLIGSTSDTIFVDVKANYGVENFYKVTSVDKSGNESSASNIASCVPGKDITPPVIDKFLPAEGTALRGNVSFTVHAKDNINVKSYKLEIRKVDENNEPVGDGEWQLVSSLVSQGSNDAKFVLNTTSVNENNIYKYPDGSYQIKVTATDSENNYTENVYTYVITNDPPSPPEKIYVEAGEWQLIVSWSPVLRPDFSHYVLYRKEGKTGAWEKILNATTSNAYIDRMLDPSKEYYYAVSVVNDMNRESAMTRDYSNDANISDDIKIHSLQETSVPVVREVKPGELSHIGNSVKLEAYVDAKVSVKVRYEYSYLGESETSVITGDETWQLIGVDDNPAYRSSNYDGFIEDYINGNTTSYKNYLSGFVSYCQWDTSALASGSYAVRVTAINTANIESSTLKRYIVDRIPPAKPNSLEVSDPKIGGQLDLHWNRNTEADIDGYKVFRSETNGGPYELIGNTKGFTFNDKNVENGKIYYYVVKAYDQSGNESVLSAQASGKASAISDLSVNDIKPSPVSPAYGREATITVVVENLGYATAKGKVELYVKDAASDWSLIDAKNVEIRGANHYEAVFEWTPNNINKLAEVKAVVTTIDSTTERNAENNSKIVEVNINQPPTAVIECKEWVYSGDNYILNGAIGTNGQLSKDGDGKIIWYKWSLGDGTSKEGAQITHVYQMPGTYNITLTVCDNDGAESSTTTTVEVRDNRPDLSVNDITWNPSDPSEQDVVNITAEIANTGKGANRMGFLVGFYIDNQYIGYTRVDKNIEVGETIKVPYTWVATPGVHVLKVVANDILDILKETDKTNNSKTVALTTKQVNFPDVVVDSVTYVAEGENLISEMPFAYRAKISNIGTANAEKFNVSLYIDGKWIEKQNINLLKPGAETFVTFIVKPTAGSHEITVKADDPSPVLKELQKDNNQASIVTPEFTVSYPKLSLADLSWMPQESVITEGTSLTFTAKVSNNSTTDITHEFNVDFIVDGQKIKTVTIDKLGAGEVVDVTARWTALPGAHNVKVCADNDNIVTEEGTVTVIKADIPSIKLIYPDLYISDVTWSPTSIKYGDQVTFIVRVSNQSVTSVFKSFNVSLFMDGKQVAAKTVNGLRGHSTAIVDLTWKANLLGKHDFKIVIDNEKALILEPLQEGLTRVEEGSINISDSLIMEAHPNSDDADIGFMSSLFIADDNLIPVSVKVSKASSKDTLLGTEDGIRATYSLERGNEKISGELGFDKVSRTFKADIPISNLSVGNYILTLEAGDGVEVLTSTCNISIMPETIATIDTDKEQYQFGQPVHINGSIRLADGTPLAQEKIVLDLQLEPRLKEPVEVPTKNGGKYLATWHGEHILELETDDNGRFSYDFYPAFGEAGLWHANVFAYKRGLGAGASTDFNIIGMVAVPSSVSITSTKNSRFSKVINIKNASDEGGKTLTGINAVLVALNPNSNVVATIDSTNLKSTLAPGETTGVVVNFNAPLDADDTAEYRIDFSSSEGAVTSAAVKLNLRPAVPMPITDPRGIEVGLNPGNSVVRTIKLTNKGMGKMTGIRLESPSRLPWITAGNLSKTELAPGESATFEILINPSADIPLGEYQDKVIVTDGKYSSTVTVAAEISSAQSGSVSFIVSDDTGVRVPNAEVNLIGKQPFIQVKDGKEVIYYQHFYGRTDANGVVVFENKPLGEYDYSVQASAHKSVNGIAYIMPKTDASIVNVTMEMVPVQIEWTVKPTTIQDKYDIKLEMTFGANIPKPYFGYVPPWVNIPKQITDPMIVEATIVNCGLVAITDVTASVMREKQNDTGISIVGGGYIGEIPAHGSAKIKLLIQPGYYNLRSGKNEATGLPYNAILLHGYYVSFDSDTGLPVDPPEEISGNIALYNPSEQKVTVQASMPSGKTVVEEIELPSDGGIEEVDYLINRDNGARPTLPGSGQSGKGAYEIVTLSLDQTATLERQAFNATLKVSNGYVAYALQNLSVRVVVTDKDGKDVTGNNFIIATGLNGIEKLDGSSSLLPGNRMTADWQIIPGDGLGGTNPEGEKYYAKAVLSYFVNGLYVETQTNAEEITIMPQPKIKLNYYLPHKVVANQPFKLGVTAENIGDGVAKNLVIDSGQLNIKSNQAGLLTKFDILDTSFGSSTGSSFRLNIGDIAPHSQVTGYWIIKWSMYEESEDAEPIEGEFLDFKASLHHQDYKGVQLNPLIVGVTTEIIGKDNLKLTNDDDVSYTLIDKGYTGIPNYLINLKTGMKLPIYVPQTLNVTKQPDANDSTLKFNVPALEGDPDDQGMPRYQVLMLKAPENFSTIRSVERESFVKGEDKRLLSLANSWMDYGNIYIVDEIPVSKEKPADSANEQTRYYYPSSYTIDFSSGAVISCVESAQIYYTNSEGEPQYAYYDIGHYIDEGMTTSVRAEVTNKGKAVESGIVEFFAKRANEKTETKIGQAAFSGLQPYNSKYVYTTWTPEKGGEYTLIARIKDSNTKDGYGETSAKINYKPIAETCADFSADVLTMAYFDGSRSYDKDGYIQAFIWDFGDGESGVGVRPGHKYLHSGTYKVKLTVIDNNNAQSTQEMQVTINETRADLRIRQLTIDKEAPKEGETVKITGTIENAGYSDTKKPFIVGFYVDNKYVNYKRITDNIAPGETKEVTFEWTNTIGNHIVTLIANDIGHPVDEADFDNNQKSRPINVSQAFFPNIKVDGFTSSVSFDNTLDWNQKIEFTANISNEGNVSTGSFNVAFYVDDYLVETKTIQDLDYKNGANESKVTFTWNLKDEGAHTLKVVADGPLAHVIETDKSDNIKEIKVSGVKLRYPDLKVESISISPDNGKIDAGQSVIINALLTNGGYSTSSKQCKVAFFADGRYLGAKDVGIIPKGGSTFVSYTWDRPINGTTTIEAYVDYNNDIHEVSDENNRLKYTVTTPMNINLPDLVIESITTEPSMGTAMFGDEVTTKISLRNTGTAYIKTPFTTALYVNKKLVGKFETKESLAPGQSTSGTVTWTADILPTAPEYELTAYADVYTKLVLSNRSTATKNAYYKVKGDVIVEPDALNSAYTLKEKPEFKLNVNSTDDPGAPLTPNKGVKARIYIYKGLPDADGKSVGEAVYSQDMVFDELQGKYTSVVDIENIGILEPGQYTVEYEVKVDSHEKKVCKVLKLVNDYIVTVDTAKQTFAANEPVEISGRVTGIDGKTPLADVNVNIIIVGEEEWKFNVRTDENGEFKYSFNVRKGYGGAYSLKASADYDGAQKMSSSNVFYIEGPVLAFTGSIKITAGYSKTIPVTVINVGTLPIAGISFDKLFSEGSDGLTAEFIDEMPESIDVEESSEIRLKISAEAQAMPGEKTLELNITCKEGYTYKAMLEIIVEEPKPKTRIDIGGGVEINEKAFTTADYIVGAFKKQKIASSLRQGSSDTQVIHIMNTGNAPITDIKVIPPATLPWVTITTSGTQLVEPVSKGLSIRDANSHASILVHISPTEFVQAGIYEDYITVISNAGESKIPVVVNVGPSSVGTFVIQVLDEDSAPVENATLELYGPISTEGNRNSNVYRGTSQGDAMFRFENIPAGSYITKITAPYHKELECNFDVQAMIELEPQKVYLEKIPFTLELTTESIVDTMNSDYEDGVNTEPVYKQVMKPEGAKPELMSHFPGYEMYDSDLLLNMKEIIGIKNSSVIGSIYGVEAKLKTENSYLPKDAVSLIKGGSDSTPVDLGDFSPQEIKDLTIYVNDDKFYDVVKIEETETPGKYTVTMPEGITKDRINGWIGEYSLWAEDGRAVTSAVYNADTGTYTITLRPLADGTYVLPSTKINKFYQRVNLDFELELTGKVLNIFGMEEDVKLNIPVRLHFVPYYAFGNEMDPRDEESIEVKAAFNPLSFKNSEYIRTKKFSENFLKKIGKKSVENPENMGTVLGSFDFSQDTVLADESFNADFSLYNPSEYQYINGAKIELIITDMELDSEGRMPAGAKILNDRFNISLTKSIKDKEGKSSSQIYDGDAIDIDTIAPENKLNVTLIPLQ